MQKADFLIIGAGMAGASAGYFLSRHGQVVVLEQESQPGYHTTGRSAAFYAPSYGNEYVRRLTLASGPFLHNPPEGFADVPLLRHRGALYIARADQLQRLASFHDELLRTGGVADLLNADQAKAHSSALQPDYVAGAVYEADCHDIDVAALHQGFLRGMETAGEVICNAPAQTIAQVEGGWKVETPEGEFVAPVLVNAAGAWADSIGQMAGVAPIGLAPLRRTIVLLPGPPDYDDDWPLVLDVDDQFYFKPEAGRVLASPGDETLCAPSDAQPEDIDVAIAVDRLTKATTITAPRIESCWAGLRTFAPDHTPVVGFEPDAKGFFWFAGQGGYGIQTAPAMGEMASQLIIDGAVSSQMQAQNIDEAAYAVTRFRGN